MCPLHGVTSRLVYSIDALGGLAPFGERSEGELRINKINGPAYQKPLLPKPRSSRRFSPTWGHSLLSIFATFHDPLFSKVNLLLIPQVLLNGIFFQRKLLIFDVLFNKMLNIRKYYSFCSFKMDIPQSFHILSKVFKQVFPQQFVSQIK